MRLGIPTWLHKPVADAFPVAPPRHNYQEQVNKQDQHKTFEQNQLKGSEIKGQGSVVRRLGQGEIFSGTRHKVGDENENEIVELHEFIGDGRFCDQVAQKVRNHNSFDKELK